MRVPESGSFYDLLGVPPDAGAAEIRAAFLRLAQRHHPDLNAEDAGADRRFKQIRRVYEILSDPLKRAAYDESPGRFRLSDAEVIGEEFGPIVTRPVHPRKSAAWPSEPRGRRGDAFRPRWLTDGRFGHESRVLRVGFVTAMLVLSVVTLLMMRSRQAEWEAHHQARQDTPTIQVVGDPREDRRVRLPETPSPMDQVISSVRDLRTDEVAPAAEGESAKAPTTLEIQVSPPSFDIVDELNVPFPGWPVIAPPPAIPDLTSSPSSATNDVNYGAPVIYSQAESASRLDLPWSEFGPFPPPPQPELPVDLQGPAPPPGPPSFNPIPTEVSTAAAHPWSQTAESIWPHAGPSLSTTSGPPTLAERVQAAAAFRTLTTNVSERPPYATSASSMASGLDSAARGNGPGGLPSFPRNGPAAGPSGGGLPPFPRSPHGSSSYDLSGSPVAAASNWEAPTAPLYSFFPAAGNASRSDPVGPVESTRPRDFGPRWNGLPMRSGSPFHGRAGAPRGMPQLPQRWTPPARSTRGLSRP